MKVLVLTSTLPARPGDGTPEFVLTLSRHLAKVTDITILAPRMKDAVSGVDGVKIKRFAYFPRRWEGLADDAILPRLKSERWRIIEAFTLMVAFVFSAIRLCIRDRPDVIHAHWVIPGGFAAWCASLITRIPFVLTVHGADAYALRGPLLGWVRRRVTSAAAHVVPVSRDIARVLSLDPETATPMGVDVGHIAEVARRRDPQRGRFVFVGRLAEKKGVDVALDALNKVSDAKLVIVGDGPDRSELEEKMLELDLTDRVNFVGRQTHDQVLEHLRQATAILIPSIVGQDGDREGTPVVLAEAIAMGVPVIGSRLGGIGEILDERSGFLVEPGSVDGFVRWIQLAVDETDFGREQAERAVLTALPRLDVSRVATHYLEVLTDAVKGNLR